MKAFFSPVVAVMALALLFAITAFLLTSENAQKTSFASYEAKRVAERAYDAVAFLNRTLEDAFVSAAYNSTGCDVAYAQRDFAAICDENKNATLNYLLYSSYVLSDPIITFVPVSYYYSCSNTVIDADNSRYDIVASLVFNITSKRVLKTANFSYARQAFALRNSSAFGARITGGAEIIANC